MSVNESRQLEDRMRAIFHELVFHTDSKGRVSSRYLFQNKYIRWGLVESDIIFHIRHILSSKKRERAPQHEFLF